MNSLRVFVDRKTVSLVAVFALLLSLALPIFASAAQVTERSIALSSSSKAATAVEYEVNFTIPTGDTGAGAVGIQFCNNTPLIGEDCDIPAGMSVAGATVVSGADSVSVPTVTDSMGPAVVVTGDTEFTAAGAKTFKLGGITNPSSAGALYARIITYDTAANATDDYDATDDDGIGGIGTIGAAEAISTGSVALSITETIGVSGAVLESMLFCVADASITADCANASANAPVLELGEDVGAGVIALGTTTSTGDLYTQISTNAAGGAIVSLKSGADCGGLKRVGATVCDIAPSLNGISAGDAEFGVRAIAAADTGSNPNGTFQIRSGSGYSDSAYYMDWVSGNASGVSSTYGDPFLDTDDAPANNKNMQLTFGAQINNSTPAGRYSADLSLIATGKF